jgi:hypothetical protein
VQQLHVARVRGVAIEDFRSPQYTPHDLGQRGVFQIGEPRPRFVVPQVRQEEVPEPFRAGEGLEIVHEGHRIQSIVDLTTPLALPGNDVVVHERPDVQAQFFDLLGVSEIHLEHSSLDHLPLQSRDPARLVAGETCGGRSSAPVTTITTLSTKPRMFATTG